MEISGAALQRSSIGSVHHRILFGLSGGGALRSATARVRVPARATGGAVFCDEGHRQYYEEKSSKQDKKRAKLIKTLKKDLSELNSIGFGVPADQCDKITVFVFLFLFLTICFINFIQLLILLELLRGRD